MSTNEEVPRYEYTGMVAYPSSALTKNVKYPVRVSTAKKAKVVPVLKELSRTP
jgi:hypothetical protein